MVTRSRGSSWTTPEFVCHTRYGPETVKWLSKTRSRLDPIFFFFFFAGFGCLGPRQDFGCAYLNALGSVKKGVIRQISDLSKAIRIVCLIFNFLG